MKIELPKFTALYDQFFKIDFTGNEPGIRPKLANARDVQVATARGAPLLPLVYRQGFAAPMDAALPHVLDNLAHEMASGEKTKAEAQTRLEVLYGPVYQHASGLTKVNVGPQLKRFLAVVSNLFRSFSDANKRAAAGVNLVTLTPPPRLPVPSKWSPSSFRLRPESVSDRASCVMFATRDIFLFFTSMVPVPV